MSAGDGRGLLADLFALDGQVAVVTGGLGRLGSQYAAALARAGASVAVFDKATAVPSTLQRLHDERLPIGIHQVDLVNRDQVFAATSEVGRRFGTPTILINNAGLGSPPDAPAEDNGPFENYPETSWDAMLESHLKTTLFASQAFIAAYRAASPQAGSIINVSSTYGVVSPDQQVYEYRRTAGAVYYKPVGYSVAKSGVLNFTRWLAEYCAPFGVRVNTLVPGGVREPEHADAFVAEYVKRTPLRRMAADDEYNGAILFLASRASAYMTGATLVVDGGWTAR